MAASPDPPDWRALLAHDLRAAMSDVIGGLRLIEPDSLPEAARTQIGRIHVASELLARLLEEALQDAPAGDAPEDHGALDLWRFLDDELRRWHGASRPTGTRVTLTRGEDVPRVVRIDGLALRRIVANLMSNALRHAPGGTIALSAALDPSGALRFRIRDDGPGFPEDMLDRLQEPSTRHGPGAGSGLGLHIAAAGAETLGGRLEARNRAGGGAEVAVSIPAAQWRIARPAPDEALPDLRGRRVLVADDSPTQRALLRALLSRLGAECEVVPDGVEASNWFQRERFDIALIDLEMPGLGGLDVIRAERLRQARGVAPPVVLLAVTAYALSDNREAIEEAGADGILPKPLPEIGALGRTLKDYLDRAPKPGEWSPERAAPFNAALLAELMAVAGPEDQATLLNGIGDDLAGVADRLGAALGDMDLSAIRAQTHVLLSLAATIGALPTQQAARRLGSLAEEGAPDPVRIAGKACLGRLEELRSMFATIR